MGTRQDGFRHKVSLASDIATIVLVLLIGYIVVTKYLLTPKPTNLAIRAGDHLPQINGVDWSEHDRTLLLVLRKGCPFCEDSAPFYRTLVADCSHRADVGLVAVFPDDTQVAQHVTESENINIETVGDVSLGKLKVPGTPTLILADRTGRVMDSWVGMLSPELEKEVIYTVTSVKHNR